MKLRFIVTFILIWIVGCTGSSQVSVTPPPAATLTPVPATPTASPVHVQPRRVNNRRIQDYYWSPDGQTLVYSQSEKCPNGCKTTWYQFDVTTGVTTTIEPKIVTIDPEVWKRLTNDTRPPETSPQQSRSISPSGKWVIYSRMPIGYTPSCAKGPCPPPIEVWVSKVDGSDSFKVADATKHGTDCYSMGWFDQEHKVLLMCGYEGPVHFVVVDLQSRTLTNLNEIAGQGIATLTWAALSPDGTRLAVNSLAAIPVSLLIVPLDGSSIVNLGQSASAPQWSPDGQRLYYLQRVKLDECAPAAIHVYNLSTEKKEVMLGSEVALSSAQRVTLKTCDHAYLVSPTEDTVLLNLGEEGSWVVPLPH